MDHVGREAPTAARWLAWATAVLLAVAGVSASVVQARNDGSGDAYVSAAGGATSTLDVPTSTSSTTTTVARPATSTTVARTTTVPKAAAAVLAAIASTTAPPTTRPPASTTSTTRPATTTTVPPTPTSTSTSTTTSTTIPAPALLTIVNDHPGAMVVTVNGTTTEVAPGQQAGPVQVTAATTGSDAVALHTVADATCQAGGVGAFFQAGSRYQIGRASCRERV